MPPATLAAVERLYAGGSYTQSRLVMHTLMHYKSFERLLIARIGPSIARHIALEEVVASGGPTVASQITLVELLLAEANAYTSALGVLSRFELRMQETHLVEASACKAAAQVHDELSVAQVRVSEMHDGVSVATYSVDEFMVIVRALRDRCTQPLMCAAVKTHIAIEQWQLVSYSGAALRSEAIAQATEDMQP